MRKFIGGGPKYNKMEWLKDTYNAVEVSKPDNLSNIPPNYILICLSNIGRLELADIIETNEMLTLSVNNKAKTWAVIDNKHKESMTTYTM